MNIKTMFNGGETVYDTEGKPFFITAIYIRAYGFTNVKKLIRIEYINESGHSIPQEYLYKTANESLKAREGGTHE